MKTSRSSLVVLAFAIIAFACQPPPAVLTDAQKATIADSAKAVAQDVARGLQKLDGPAVFARCSSDPDARYLENGFLYSSYGAFKDSLYADFTTLDSLSTQIDALNVVVLGAEAAVITESFQFTAMTKTGEEVEGKGVASMVVQLRAGRWQIVQSHESELNVVTVLDSATAHPSAVQKSSKR